VINTILLLWFGLDMIGLSIGGELLVSQAYQDDGIFFLIYLLMFLFFMIRPKKGYYGLLVWLILWFITQFFSHWYFTITDSGEEKIEYFSDTIKLIYSNDIYIADLYHIVLHIFILMSIVALGLDKIKNKA
jgi:hypothetical protein